MESALVLAAPHSWTANPIRFADECSGARPPATVPIASAVGTGHAAEPERFVGPAVVTSGNGHASERIAPFPTFCPNPEIRLQFSQENAGGQRE
jgi:hypothetical protein